MFRKLMAIEDRYHEFKFLRRDVIQPAIKEVNAVSNIQIDLRTIRTGRSVTAVQFTVAPSPQTALFGLEEEDEISTSKAYEALREEGISKDLARSWVIAHGEAYVLEKVAITRGQDSQGKIKSSRSGFLKAAIVEDFQSQEAAKRKEKATADQVRDEKWKREKELERLNTEYRDVERRYREYCSGEFQRVFDSLSSDEQEQFSAEFLRALKLPLERREFRERGWMSRVVFPAAKDFWAGKSLALEAVSEFCTSQKLPDPEAMKVRIKSLEGEIR